MSEEVVLDTATASDSMSEEEALLTKLIEDISNKELEYIERGTGSFTNPANRAFAFRILIQRLVEPEYAAARLQQAIEKYDDASQKDIWDPITSNPEIKRLCESYRAVAKEIIDRVNKA